MKPNVYLYILVMAGVTYLIRMLPLVLFKREITSPFVKSFLYYVPYACLAAMTFPAILTATAGGIISGAAGLIVALIVAYYTNFIHYTHVSFKCKPLQWTKKSCGNVLYVFFLYTKPFHRTLFSRTYPPVFF